MATVLKSTSQRFVSSHLYCRFQSEVFFVVKGLNYFDLGGTNCY